MVDGMPLPWGKTTSSVFFLVGVALLPAHLDGIHGDSRIADSRTRKTGERVANEKVAPRAHAPSWLSVVESDLVGNRYWISERMTGMRGEPPTSLFTRRYAQW